MTIHNNYLIYDDQRINSPFHRNNFNLDSTKTSVQLFTFRTVLPNKAYKEKAQKLLAGYRTAVCLYIYSKSFLQITPFT